MPDTRDLVMPSGGFTKNAGLQNALRDGAYRIRVLQRIYDIIGGFDDSSSDYYRADYLKPAIKRNVMSASTNLDASVWRAGEIHEFDCGNLGNASAGSGGVGTGGGSSGNGNGNGNGGGKKGGGSGGGGGNTVKIPSGTTLVRGAIYTDCLITIGSNSTLEDVLIISENRDIAAISGASGVTFGRDDGCAPGGGSQVVTLGGVNFPAKLSMYGSQIIAEKKIDFEANANGIEGVSMVSGGEIDSTSNMQMGFCNGAGMENRFEAEYFRMAR